MNATCEQCTCNGVGTCPACVRIRLTVAAEARPPARRTGCGPATVTPFDIEAAVREHRAYLTAYAQRKIGNRQDAEDAVQEALVSLWCRRDQYADVGNSLALLVGFTKSSIATARTGNARRSREVSAGDDLDRAPDRCNTFCDASAGREHATDVPCLADPGVEQAVWGALADLPERFRTAVRLRCLDGVPSGQAATRMGVTPRQFEHMAMYGLRMLRRRASGCLRTLDTADTGGRADPATVELVRTSTMLHKLSLAQREVLRLRYVERLTYTEAARRLGVSAASVRGRAAKAAARLREWEAGRPPCRPGPRPRVLAVAA